MRQNPRFFTGAAVLAAIVAAPCHALAQGATPVPLSKATVSDDIAKRTLVKYQLNSTLAREIVNACVEFARNQQGGPGNYAIFVLAPNGDIIDAHVMDGVVPIGVETGLLKAKTALYARTPSSAVAQRFSTVERPADSDRPGPRRRSGLLLRRRRPPDRRGKPADWRNWRGRRQHGRGVRARRADQGPRAAAAAADRRASRRGRRSRAGPGWSRRELTR